MMRLSDAVADLRIHIEARRARPAIDKAVSVVVGIIKKERDRRAGNQRQVLPGRLQVDGPRTAGVNRGRLRNDLRGY